MPRNGSGSYSLPQPPFVPGTVISSSAVNSDFSDIATALTQSVSADGQTAITGILKGSITSGPILASTVDNTTGFGVTEAGEAVIFASGEAIMEITDTSVTINAPFDLSNLNITSTQAGVSVTVTSASPAVITWLAHGFLANQPVFFTASVIPVGMVAYQTYYVVGASITTNTFEVSTTVNGSAVNTTSTGTSVLGFTPALSVVGGAQVEDGLTTDDFVAQNAIIGTATITNLTAGGLPLPGMQGYLTLASGTPIITSDIISATTLYYTPYTGAWAVINNGTTFIPYNFTQLSLTLSASQAANNIYDIYLAYNSGSPVIGTGPSWAAGTSGSVTAGSCARGTGTGGASISRNSSVGLWVNTVSMSLIYNIGAGNITITVPAGQGIYLGSIYIDAIGGQVSCYRSWGQNRKFGVWNAYNRTPIILQAGDNTSSWTYATSATIRASNNNPSSYSGTAYNTGSGIACNGFTVLSGLSEEAYNLSFTQAALSNNTTFTFGIGYNSTTAYSGTNVLLQPAATSFITSTAFYAAPPSLGINIVASLEAGNASANTTYDGTQAHMLLQGFWRG
jgi:hypothetical protein